MANRLYRNTGGRFQDVSKQSGAADLDVVVRADRACPASHLNTLAGALTRVGVRDWKLATAGGGGR